MKNEEMIGYPVGAIEEETLIKSIFVNSVYFSEDDFSIDLATSPDYF